MYVHVIQKDRQTASQLADSIKTAQPAWEKISQMLGQVSPI